jgi:hypothetical protein
VTFPEFDDFYDKLLVETVKMRDSKGKEYAHSADRFANFDRAAERLGISRTMVANVYLHKHLDAIDSYILNRKTYSGENIRGRIVDAITYLGLIAGMIEEDTDNSSRRTASNSVSGNFSDSSIIQRCFNETPSPNRYVCSRPKGHVGPHHIVDFEGTVLESWPNA